MNLAIIIGNLGQDPDTKTTTGGTVIANLRVATNERRKGADGEWGDHTEWHSVTVFGKTAEACQKFLKKGSKVCVEGRIQTRKWQDKEGKDRYTTEIVANNVEFLSSGEKREGGGGQSSAGGSDDPGSKPFKPDDDIPFGLLVGPVLASAAALDALYGLVASGPWL